MIAFNTATLVLFASLGLVGLAFALLVRSYSTEALAIGLAGLLGLSTAMTWLTYTVRTSEAAGAAPQAARIAQLVEDRRRAYRRIEDLEERIGAGKTESERLRAELAKANDRQTGRLTEAQQEVGRAQQEAAKAKEEARRLAAELKAEQTRRAKAEDSRAAAAARVGELESRVAALDQKLARIAAQSQQPAPSTPPLPQPSLSPQVAPAPPQQPARPQPAAPPAQPPAPSDTPPSVVTSYPADGATQAALRRRLARRIDHSLYTLEPIAQRQVVSGLAGSWYVVRLKIGNRPLTFADRQFRKPEAVRDLRESALQLYDDILLPLGQQARTTRLFVRGEADSRRVAGAVDAEAPQELQFLPRLPNGTYHSAPRRHRLPTPVRNEDLPRLRADWVRDQIQPVLLPPGAADIEVLDNRPVPGGERTAKLILYVEW